MATKEEILSTFNSKEGAWFAYKEGMIVGYNEALNSLRNQAAIAAMQGMLANAALVDDVRLDYRITIEQAAVSYANTLVEELRKK